MPQSLAKVYIHIVFSTKNHIPFLSDVGTRNEMHAYMGGVCKEMECRSVVIGGVADHVHVLSLLSRTISIAKLVEEMKKSSSKWIKTKGVGLKKFSWQNGYGVFSVSESGVDAVKAYIVNQESHHKKRTFREEVIDLLKEHHLEYDDKYLWD
jgi:putative transposase